MHKKEGYGTTKLKNKTALREPPKKQQQGLHGGGGDKKEPQLGQQRREHTMGGGGGKTPNPLLQEKERRKTFATLREAMEGQKVRSKEKLLDILNQVEEETQAESGLIRDDLQKAFTELRKKKMQAQPPEQEGQDALPVSAPTHINGGPTGEAEGGGNGGGWEEMTSEFTKEEIEELKQDLLWKHRYIQRLEEELAECQLKAEELRLENDELRLRVEELELTAQERELGN